MPGRPGGMFGRPGGMPGGMPSHQSFNPLAGRIPGGMGGMGGPNQPGFGQQQGPEQPRDTILRGPSEANHRGMDGPEGNAGPGFMAPNQGPLGGAGFRPLPGGWDCKGMQGDIGDDAGGCGDAGGYRG
jgi:hypothetical protein